MNALINSYYFSLSKFDVINQESFKAIEDVITCKICLDLLSNTPKTCKDCQWNFCKDCLKEYCKFVGKVKCPNCGKNKGFYSSDYLLGLLEALDLKCKNDCGKVVKYSELKSHYFYDCDNLDYICTLYANSDSGRSSSASTKDKKKSDFETYTKKEAKEHNHYSGSIDYESDSNSDFELSSDELIKKDKKKKFFIFDKSHECQLYLIARQVGWICDVCKSSHNRLEASFCCKGHDFDLCMKCAGY